VSLELQEGLASVPASSASGLTPDARRMLEAIDNLPEEEREAFDLVRIQGLAQVEAADILGVSPKTVLRRLNRAALRLDDALGDLRPDGGDEGLGIGH
jgi:DNA-directed RNA polymerase specialized sigma24 family protein